VAQDCLHRCLAQLVAERRKKVIAKEWRKTVCTYVLRSLLQKQGKLNISSADFSLLLAGLCGEQSSKSSSADICMGKQAAFKVMGWLSGQRKALKKMKIKIKNIKIMIKTKINSQIYIGKTKNEDKK
jgi:hypothetical protein